MEPNSSATSKIERFYLHLEIEKIIQIGAIVLCQDTIDQFISKIFVIPKSDGKYRLILNLKCLNKFVETIHFKMDDFRTATRLMSPFCYMASIDLKDAYFLIAMHETSKKYLRFKFEQQTYEFQCLPFGLSSAPYIFTKLLKPVVSLLRSEGFFIVNYLDDFLCLGNSYDECLNCVTKTMDLLLYLGFVINYEKSQLKPNQCRKFLGFELNSIDMKKDMMMKR